MSEMSAAVPGTHGAEQRAPAATRRDERRAATIAACIAQLAAASSHEVSAAAERLFHHAHVSHAHAAENKDLVRELGGIPALCAVLQSDAWPVRRHACSALSELAYGSKLNCQAIVTTKGALHALIALFQHDTLNIQELAALVVNNCAGFGDEACVNSIVKSPGVLEALQHLAQVGSCRAKCVTIGAMNCLSRWEQARDSLLRMRVVERVLLPVLREAPACPQDVDASSKVTRAREDRLAARRMRAFMSLVNLTGRCDYEHVHERAALTSLVQVLDCTLQPGGGSWAGLRFSTYSVLYPLSRLAYEGGNVRAELIAGGLVGLMVRYISGWTAGPERTDADAGELALALTIIEHLASDWGSHERLRQAGLVGELQELAKRMEGSSLGVRADALAQRLFLAPLAVCMGQHPRLGSASPIAHVDEYVMTLILGFCVLSADSQRVAQ